MNIPSELPSITLKDEAAPGTIDIKELLHTLHRHKKIIAGTILASIILMLVFLFLQAPIYKAKTLIQINVKTNKVVDYESVVSGISPDDSAIQSEIDIITGGTIAAKVVDKLNLTKDREFNPSYSSRPSWFSSLLSYLGKNKTPEELETEARLIRTTTINAVSKNLKVSRRPKSYTIEISFTSLDPKKAALIANSFVDEYLVSQLSNQFELTKRANDWLNSKISDLQKQLQQSELAVQAFREQNDLIETGGLTINDQQLSELNTQLILASTARAQAEARLHSSGYSTDSSSEVLNSNLIQNLRQQEAEILRKQSDLSNRYGSKHPKMITASAELRDLRQKIAVEIDKIKIGLRKEVEIARVREQALSKALEKLQGKAGVITKSRIELEELVRQRDANRSLYESFLLRAKQTSQNKDLQQFNASIISAAEPPIRPAYPRKGLMLIIAAILGSVVAVVIVFIIEHLDNSFKTSQQLEKETGLPSIGLIPLLDNKTDLIEYIISKPISVFSESLRYVLTSLHFSNPDHIPKSVLITSSLPEEGKTTFSIALATMMARAGQNILLIDCDLRKPSITKKMGLDKVKYSLADYLAGDATEEQIINIDKRSNIHFVSSNQNIANSRDLLASNKMKDFVAKMSKQYNLVIIDSAPVMAISDSIIVANFVDAVLFLAGWNKTPKPVIKEALKKLQYKNIKIAGTVLNQVDLERMNRYYSANGNYYDNYQQYYSE